MKELVILCLMAFGIISCGEDKWKNYGGGYELGYFDINVDTQCWIQLNIGEVIYGGDTKEEQIRKGKWIKFVDRNNSIDSCIVGKGGAVIDSYVDDAIFDNKFILVDQKDLDSIFGPYKIHIDQNNDTSSIRKIPESMEGIEISNFHQYWIINKNIDYVYGPFRKEEYLQKKKELGVPVNLKLKFEK